MGGVELARGGCHQGNRLGSDLNEALVDFVDSRNFADFVDFTVLITEFREIREIPGDKGCVQNGPYTIFPSFG